MSVQLLPMPIPDHDSYNSPINCRHNAMFSLTSRFGVCNSLEKMPNSNISSGNCTRASGPSGVIFCLAVFRCGGPQEMQIDKFNDGYYMKGCVELARKAIGCTSPNPMVGCVILKDGKIVGEGFHPKAGQPHAEMSVMIRRIESLPTPYAGCLAENGTVYVTVEPCKHYGRTPPCTEALMKARVKNVVVGMVDPNPIVASTGVKRLQDAGIEVTVGVEEELCKRLNEAYIHYMLTGKPYVTLRYSMSLDGHILDQLGEKASECGGYYSKFLQEYDGIIVPSSMLADNSSIPTSKEPGANQPLKIMLSKGSTSPIKIPDSASKLVIITEKAWNVEPHSVHGVGTLSLEKISLLEILEHCKNQGLCSVLLDLRGHYADFEGIYLKRASNRTCDPRGFTLYRW